MKALFVVTIAVIAGTSAAYAQQQPRFTTCSQVAEFAKQQCSTSAPRPMICQNRVEQNRADCIRTGTWEKTTAGGAAGQPITNLRRE
jgi:hypothetical protein